jgi:hypothetical protein
MKAKKCAMAILIFFVIAITAFGENFENFDKDSRLDILSRPVRCLFDAAADNDSKALGACFSDHVSVDIASMRFNGPEEVVAFAERDIWGGKYKVEKAFDQGDKEVVHCLFWPRGWSSPEPPIEYQFQIKNGKIIEWLGKYR